MNLQRPLLMACGSCVRCGSCSASCPCDPTIDKCDLCGCIRSGPQFDGETYAAEIDERRLRSALGRVWNLMRDGHKRTLREIADTVGTSEAGASARLRDLRKEKFSRVLPTIRVHSERADRGLWMYWIEVPSEYRK